MTSARCDALFPGGHSLRPVELGARWFWAWRGDAGVHGSPVNILDAELCRLVDPQPSWSPRGLAQHRTGSERGRLLGGLTGRLRPPAPHRSVRLTQPDGIPSAGLFFGMPAA